MLPLIRPFILSLTLAFAIAAPASAKTNAFWSWAALDDLRAVAASTEAEGLPSEAAAIEELAALRERARTDKTLRAAVSARADALLARLALAYAQGAVDPAVDPTWYVPRPIAPDIATLRDARAHGALPSLLLAPLLPRHQDYTALRDELARVRLEAADSNDADGRSRADRIASLRASLERWRWLPRWPEPDRVTVRIPFFDVVVSGESPTRHTAIVGARRTPTPSFVAAIEEVTLNPTWTPPRSILSNELLPRFRRNPAAAAGENFEAIDASGRVIDAANVDWRERPFPYTLRQRAGPGNALGLVKIEMPNPHAVYLHDTPSRRLFARDNRALSHGCVRVEDPIDLAASLLAPAWNATALQAEIDTGATQSIPLITPRAVYVLYITAAAEGGAVRYADDIYRRDASIVGALDASPRTTAAAANFTAARRLH